MVSLESEVQQITPRTLFVQSTKHHFSFTICMHPGLIDSTTRGGISGTSDLIETIL